jgi:transglutaminase-like putative cysteine protease
MSWLRLRHTTLYTYSGPVLPGPHRLVLRPREGHDLRVESFALRIEPEARVEWRRDIFGNSVARVADFAGASERLLIEAEAVLWRSLADPSPPSAGRAPRWPVVYDGIEAALAGSYRAPVYPEDGDTVRAWMAESPLGEAASATAVLDRLCRRIHGEIGYARRDEKGVFSPARTIALRGGSCRDMATLFLEAGRSLGFAMRFASGYLECAASRAGRATTHAWVEAYLPELGWRGYDASTGGQATAAHIVAGVSQHPRGVMPVSGTFRGEGVSALGMSASVFTERLDRAEPAKPGAEGGPQVEGHH